MKLRYYSKKNGRAKKSFSRENMKTLDCSIVWNEKSITKDADGAVYITGYANTVDKDRVDDVVLPEAFEKSLPTYMENPVLLYMHDWDKVCGKIVEAEIDQKGLKVRARISGAKDCDDVRVKVKDGSLSTFSIGYNEVEAEWDKGEQVNIVKEVELLEISIVSIPCNTQAKFTPEEDSSKDEDKTLKLDEGLLSFIAEAINLLDGSEKLTTEFLAQVADEYVKTDKE